MNKVQKEKCNKLIKAFAPSLEKFRSYVADVGKYGYIIVTAESKNPKTSFAVGPTMKNYEEVKASLIHEHIDNRVTEIICSLPSEEEKERRTDIIMNQDDILLGVDEADREKILAEVEEILKKVK